MDRNGYRQSLLQEDHNVCFLCGRCCHTERHEIFGGAYRQKSKHDGLWVSLCSECHRDGRQAVHNDYTAATALKKQAELKWIDEFNQTEDAFQREYGRNYL